MKIAPFVNKLNASKEYKEFIGKHPDSYMVAGFFVMDFESGNSLHQLDYYVPKAKKVAGFTIEPKVSLQMMELLNDKKPEKLEIDSKIDLEALQGILDDEMKNRGMTEDIKKIIAILQTIDGKKMWSVNCVLSGMSLLRAHIEDESKTVLKMEKSSMMDFVKKMPGSQLPAAMGGNAGQEVPMAQPAGKVTKDQIKQQIDKLSKIEEAIEKEKEKFPQALDSKKEKDVKKSKKK